MLQLLLICAFIAFRHHRCRLRRVQFLIDILRQVPWEVPLEHFMVHLVDIDLDLEVLGVRALLHLLDILRFDLLGDLDVTEAPVFQH